MSYGAGSVCRWSYDRIVVEWTNFYICNTSPTSAKVKNACSYASLCSYAILSWYLIQYKIEGDCEWWIRRDVKVIGCVLF
jgi:hypothetical protein